MPIDAEWTDPDDIEAFPGMARSADFNALAGNVLFHHRSPRVALRRNTNLDVGDSSHVTIPWEHVIQDVGDWFASSSPTVAVVPRDGMYIVQAKVLWSSNAEGDRQVRLLRNGDPLGGDRRPATTHTEQPTMFLTNLAEGQALSVDVRQQSGETIQVEARTSPTTRSPVLVALWVGAPIPGLG